MSVKRKKIITKMYGIGYGLLLIIFCGGGFFFYNEIRTLSQVTHSIYHHPLVVSNAATQCSLEITKMHRTMKDIVLFDDVLTIEESFKTINQYEQNVYDNLGIIKEKILGEHGKALAGQAELLFRNWKPIRDEVIALVLNREIKKAALITKNKGAHHVVLMEIKMQALNDYAKNKASTFLNQSDQIGAKIKKLSLSFLVLGILLSFLILGVTIFFSLKSENELIRSEHRHRVIFENSPLGMIRFSSVGTIVDCNDKFVALMGSTKEKLIGFNTAKQSPPKMQEAIKKALKGETSVFEDQYTSVTGNRTIDIRVAFNPVSPDKTFTEVIATLEDITERKQAERRLQENKARLQTIFQSAQSGIILLDSETCQVLDVNAAAAKMIKRTPREIIGEKSYGFIFPANKGAGLIPDLDNEVENSEEFILTSDGEKVPILKTITNVSINGRPCILECFVDISQQKEVEAVLRDAKEAAESATRLKAEFLANMSHEIRTPMNGVVGMAELLASTPLNKEQADYVDTIKASGDALLTIINDVLDYSKIEAGKVTLEKIEFNLRTVLVNVADISALKAQDKNLEYCTIIHPDVPTYLLGDPGRLRQILINLIGNSIKFTDKGEIIITVRLEKETQTNAIVHFSIIDTGIGIPSQKTKEMFESFSQVDSTTTRKYGGTGLGLSISKQLSELMGGNIGVNSKEGKGSQFWFTADFKKMPAGHGKVKIVKQDISGKHILIVDDNQTNRFVLKEDLKRWGCRFDEASNGIQALEKLKTAMNNHDPYEIAIIDNQMPQMDGATLGGKIKQDKKLNQTILIMLTSIGKRGDAKWIKDIGFSAYLKKPIKQKELYECLSTVYHVTAHPQKTDSNPIMTRHSIAENLDEGVRILLVEDNHINTKVALGALKKLGFKADVAENGLQALHALKTIQYDIVLMDCQMPEMDGYQATKQLRNPESKVLNSRIPVIAMTANAMAEDRDKCLNAGMNDYMSKPVTMASLSEMLDKWLNK